MNSLSASPLQSRGGNPLPAIKTTAAKALTGNYRIRWVSRRTGEGGCGQAVWHGYDACLLMCEYSDMEFPELSHRPEYAPASPPLSAVDA